MARLVSGWMVQAPRSNPETAQATLILAWTDAVIRPSLKDQVLQAYLAARVATGTPAMGRPRIKGGPTLYGVPLVTVEGTVDEVYGHNRLTLVVTTLLPEIRAGRLPAAHVQGLRQRCRGHFATLAQEIERAHQAALARQATVAEPAAPAPQAQRLSQ